MSTTARLKSWLKNRLNHHYMRKYGLEALARIHEVSTLTGKPVWLDYGTLLGAYREHGFIKHDNDIDVGMFAADYDHAFERALFDKGFKILRMFTKVETAHPERRQLTELTLKYKQVQIDIFLKIREDGQTNCYAWADACKERNVWKAYRETFEYTTFSETDFLGIRVLVPDNTKEFLAYKYGEHFMTPDPTWRNLDKRYLPLEECYGECRGGWMG